MVAFWVTTTTSCINKERSSFSRDRDWVEEEGPGWAEAVGGSIGQVLSTQDVLGVYCCSSMIP